MNTVGVLGAGKFGLTVSNLLAKNTDVLLYARKSEAVNQVNTEHSLKGITLAKNITATQDLNEITSRCQVIYPIVPSANFRDLIKSMSAMLKPDHFIIHGTKGLDLVNVFGPKVSEYHIEVENIRTMSDVIKEESAVVRVGCISGPNLSDEINQGLPTAAVIASEYTEVIKLGESQLSSNKFFVFGSHDLRGTELSGSLKNIIAIGSGILESKGLGKNMLALLVTRGLREMIHIGSLMGTSNKAFLGTAGIGDLIATASSSNSRNFKFGYRLGQGEKSDDIIASMNEVAEGVRTLKIVEQLIKHHKIQAPITKMLYQVVFEDFNIDKAVISLMRYPFATDVDFM